MTTKRRAKREYLARRRRRVRDLYLRDGYAAREIAGKLVNDGTIETSDESLDSAIRLVQSDVAAIRAEIDAQRTADADGKVAGNQVDVMERELERLRCAYDKQRAISEDESMVTTTTVTPNGPLLVERAKWPAGVRQKAAKDAATIATNISRLEAALATQRSERHGEQQPAEGFRFVFPNVTGVAEDDLHRLIARNQGDRNKVN